MYDHNLDDLILDKPSRRRNGVKNFLTLAGLLVIILVAGIVLSRMILNDAAETLATQEIDDIGAENPELELKKPTEHTTLRLNENGTPPPAQVRHESSKKEELPVRQPLQTEKPIPAAPHTDTKSEHQETETSTVKKTASNPLKKSISSSTQKGDFYIQVGSFSKTPPKKSLILQKIKRYRFSYIVRESRSGAKKVLIGPYRNRAKADRAIVEIRRRITPQAFVVAPKQ